MDEPQAPLTEREQFETWLMQHSSMRAFSSPSAAAKRRDEMYWYAHVRCAWQSWQARAALASAPHPTTPSKTLGDALTGPGDPVASLPTPPIAAGDVPSVVSLGSRGTINLLAVERIEPRGEYPDEVTVVMKSGARFSVSAQAAGRPSKSDAMEAWSELVAQAARISRGAA